MIEPHSHDVRNYLICQIEQAIWLTEIYGSINFPATLPCTLLVIPHLP